jgi:hypothetical protein
LGFEFYGPAVPEQANWDYDGPDHHWSKSLLWLDFTFLLGFIKTPGCNPRIKKLAQELASADAQERQANEVMSKSILRLEYHG